MATGVEPASFRFRDRHHAGLALAEQLTAYRGRSDLVVAGLPRGGVPVAFQVALALHAPLDVFVVRKLGWPGHEEFAMGAIASGGVRVLNPNLADILQSRKAAVDAATEREGVELVRREQLYRAGRAPIALAGRSVLLVDDGLATGSTMLAAVAAARRHEPAAVVVAVPVASRDACARMRAEADDVVCAVTPDPFEAVGCWYEDFAQTSDAEVQALLAEARDGSRQRRLPPGSYHEENAMEAKQPARKKDDKGADQRLLRERIGQVETGPHLHPQTKETGRKGASNVGEDESSGSE